MMGRAVQARWRRRYGVRCAAGTRVVAWVWWLVRGTALVAVCGLWVGTVARLKIGDWQQLSCEDHKNHKLPEITNHKSQILDHNFFVNADTPPEDFFMANANLCADGEGPIARPEQFFYH